MIEPGPQHRKYPAHAIADRRDPGESMIAALRCATCPFPGPAVPVERVSDGAIVGVCPRCQAHWTTTTVHMESR